MNGGNWSPCGGLLCYPLSSWLLFPLVEWSAVIPSISSIILGRKGVQCIYGRWTVFSTASCLWKDISGKTSLERNLWRPPEIFPTVHLKQTQVQWDYRNWLECLNAFAMPYISSCFVMLYGQETRFRLWQKDRQSHLYRNIIVRHHHALVSWIPQNVHQVFLLKFSFFPAAIIVLSTVAQNVLFILCEKQLPGTELCFLAFFFEALHQSDEEVKEKLMRS